MNNLEQTNQIQETDINTRKELWDNLFGFLNTDNWANQQPSAPILASMPSIIPLPSRGKRWPHKDSNFLPLPGTYKLVKEQIQTKLKDYDSQITNLITAWKSYFTANIIPCLKNIPDGDKALEFHCQRLFDHQIIGVVSHLLPDLLVFEVEYRQVKKFKELLPKLNDWCFNKVETQQQWETDLKKMTEGRIGYGIAQRFWFKWSNNIGLSNLVKEVSDYLDLWRIGKGATNQWKATLTNYQIQLANLFATKETLNTSFLNFGKVKAHQKNQKTLSSPCRSPFLIVTTQNKGGWDFDHPALLVFWFWQKTYRAYRVREFRYLDINYLNVELTLEEDWAWKNYERSLVSGGTLNSEKHPLYLPSKRVHFPFCEDLGDKKVYHLSTENQPKWELYIINHPNWVEKIGDLMNAWTNGESQRVDFGDSGADISLPNNLYKIERYQHWITGFWKDGITVFLASRDFYKGITTLGIGSERSNCFYQPEPIHGKFNIPPDLNRLLLEQEHLLDHSTFQFHFFNQSVLSANLRYLDTRRENEQWVINYVLKIKATPAGTYYLFISKNIIWNIKLEVKQTIPSAANLKAALKGATVVATIGAFAVMAGMGAATAGTQIGVTEGIVDISAGVDWKESLSQAKQIQSLLPDEGEEEVSFSSSLFDFWSKINRDEAFWAKTYISENLYNNLRHNNNPQVITYPLNITFPRLDEIIKKGDWQGELRVFDDHNKNLETKFREGVRFYEDLDKDLTKANLDITALNDVIRYGLRDTGGFVGEEIREWTWNEVPFDYRAEAKGYGHSTYLNVDNSSVRANEWKALGWSHWDDNLGWCWGCTQQMFSPTGYTGNAHDANSPACPTFPKKEVGTITPSQTCRVEMKLHVDNSNTVYETLEAGIEYKIAADDKRIYFGRMQSSGIRIKEVAGRNDFTELDWNPLPAGHGNINITPNEPEINIPEPGVDNLSTDPGVDLAPDFDARGEPEIPFIEPDIALEPDPNEPDDSQDFDPPNIEIDPPEIVPPEPDIPTDPDLPGNDTEPGDNGIPDFDPSDYE